MATKAELERAQRRTDLLDRCDAIDAALSEALDMTGSRMPFAAASVAIDESVVGVPLVGLA